MDVTTNETMSHLKTMVKGSESVLQELDRQSSDILHSLLILQQANISFVVASCLPKEEVIVFFDTCKDVALSTIEMLEKLK